MILQELEKSVKGALAKLGLEAEAVSFEHPENLEHGDYSSNIALVLGKKGGRSVQELAEAIASRIEGSKLVSRVEVAGPGFLNFFLDTGYLSKELSNIGKEKEKYGTGKAGRKKVMVEFTDPNPFKEFHIGHLYSNAVGESLSRLLEAEGADVRRVNYQGDVGLHVAKAVWGMRAGLEESGLSLKDLEKEGLSERVRFLGRSYAMGDAAYETGAAKEDIEELNVKIFARDESVSELYENGKKWSLEYFENIYGRLGTAFDHYYFESEVGKTGERIVKEGLKKGIFEESEGAVIFPGEKYGLHSRVFVNSRGLPTYEAKELGLAPTKYKDFSYDLSLIVTGNEIIGYFKVLLAALKETNPELAEKTRHLSHGMVRLPEGKMSSRTGNIVTAEQLIEEVKARVQSIMESSGSEIPKEEREEAAEHIAVGAIKYSLLRVSLGKDIA
ncbi:MAG: arginine--tRNA ligase, partial [bacterium]|nr:arginine--tRNA ligase [bacterium]